MFDGERKKDCPPHQRYDKQPSKSVVIEYTEKHSALLCDWHSCRFLFNGEALPPRGRLPHFCANPVRVLRVIAQRRRDIIGNRLPLDIFARKRGRRLQNTLPHI